MYARFLNERGNQSEENADWYKPASGRIKPDGKVWCVDLGFEQHPVVSVTWYGARAYAGWVEARVAPRSPVGKSRPRRGWAQVSLGRSGSRIKRWLMTGMMWSAIHACGQLSRRRQPLRRAGYGGECLAVDPQPVGHG